LCASQEVDGEAKGKEKVVEEKKKKKNSNHKEKVNQIS